LQQSVPALPHAKQVLADTDPAAELTDTERAMWFPGHEEHST
jgi:hypothetical protein